MKLRMKQNTVFKELKINILKDKIL